MKMRNIVFSAAGILAASAVSVSAQQQINNNATEVYDRSNVQAQLRLNIEKETDTVHFVRDNTDPYVITKTYILKHADPYELRPYLRTVVQAKKITQDDTYIECIKYNDGTGALIVSAEEDRFGKQPNGIGIDEIVAALDQPKITSSSGMVRFLYFPMYRNAEELRNLVFNVGTTHTSDPYELERGTDKVYWDNELNAMFFYVPKFSRKNIESMLKYYDTPINQATVKYTVYEVYAENDGKIGADFQSWKNNDGADLLSTGGRYRSNWTSTWDGGIAPQTGSNKTQYFNFNPKWNSKYLDFLVSKSSAKVLTTGAVLVRNNQTATIVKQTGVFYDKQTQIAGSVIDQTITTKSGVAITMADMTISDGDSVFAITGTATSAAAVKFNPHGNSSMVRYMVAIDGGGAFFTKNGVNVGKQIDVASFATVGNDWNTWTNDITVAKGMAITTEVSAGTNYGFTMTVLPQVNRESTSIKVDMQNSSLIGWKSDGSPRISVGNRVVTDIMIDNGSNRFVIGGMEKRDVVRSVSGVPLLRELPGIGWLFSTESESTKLSRLVVVGECQLTEVKAPVSDAITGSMKQIDNKLVNAGKTNSWGYDQYFIDKK